MNEKALHKRIILNKNPMGQIEYCEACALIEVVMGPISVRLQAKDLVLFRALVCDAEMRYAFYESEKAQHQLQDNQQTELH